MIPGTDGFTSDLQCYRCQEWGHISPNCPNAAPIGRVFLMKRMQFEQDKELTGFEHSCVLLDTFSTNITCNDSMHLTNITQCYFADKMNTLTNGGPWVFQKQVDFKLFPIKVHFDQDSLISSAEVLCSQGIVTVFSNLLILTSVYVGVCGRPVCLSACRSSKSTLTYEVAIRFR